MLFVVINSVVITVNRFLHSVIETWPLKNGGNKIKRQKKRLYNRKTPRGMKVVKNLIQYMYESRNKNTEKLYFVTITTKQHETGFSDGELNRRFGLWTKNRTNFMYVNIVERQRDTSDLHYHLVIRTERDFQINLELRKLSRLFNVEYHPALFEVKRLTNVRQVVGYLNKYVSKGFVFYEQPIETFSKPPYSSLFFCRTYTVSRNLSKSYKRDADKSVVRVSSEIKQFYPHLFVDKYKEPFFRSYQYNDDLWAVARSYSEFKRKALTLPESVSSIGSETKV